MGKKNYNKGGRSIVLINKKTPHVAGSLMASPRLSLICTLKNGLLVRPSTLPALNATSSVPHVRRASWLPWKAEEKGQISPVKVEKIPTDTSRPKFVRVRNPRTGLPRVGSNWNETAELTSLAQRLGHDKDILSSLKVALSDRSLLRAVPSSKDPAKSKPKEYTRLSVLGRSNLTFYVNEYLYFSFPKLEGTMLTDLCMFLTKDEALAKLANYVGVTDLICTQRVLDDPSNTRFVADVLCAVAGAIYETKGPQAARKLVFDFVVPQLSGTDIHELIKLEHPRFMLHTILKSQGLPRAESRLIKESGRATHFPTFVVGVFVGDKLLGEGHGTSIKRAEKEAMVAALVKEFQSQLTSVPLPSDNDAGFIPEDSPQLATEVAGDSSTIVKPSD